MSTNLREQILATACQQQPGRVPWTIYRGLLPRGQAEMALRQAGLALQVQVPVYSIEQQRVEIERRQVIVDGHAMQRTTYHTPIGQLDTLSGRNAAAYDSSWTAEPLLKSVDDYRIMRYIIEDGVVTDNYAGILRAQDQLGDAGLVLGAVGLSPFQQLVTPEILGMDGVSYWLLDHPTELDGLVDALTEQMAAIYALAAQAPVEIIHSDENMTALMTSPRIYQKYHLAFYERMVPQLHAAGKRYACHFDGSTHPLLDLIAASPIDIIEALTPPPMGDLSMHQALESWPDKVLWINFPGNVFLWPRDQVAEYTQELLRECAPTGRLVLGITENIPDTCWKSGLAGIADGFASYYK